MAKALSKSQLASELAAKSGLTKKAGAEMLDHLAALAYKHAKNTFTLPGIGKLVLQNRKARLGRNPATGAHHPDSGQKSRQIPRVQSRQGRHPRSKVVLLAVRRHSDFSECLFFKGL